MDYVELSTRSAFSFLRASSDPEALVECAAQLGHRALALSDCDGLSGAPRFFAAARKAGLHPLVGAELSLQAQLPGPRAGRARARASAPASPRSGASPKAGIPRGSSVVLLVESPAGYRRLCRLLTRAHLGRPRGQPGLTLDELADELWREGEGPAGPGLIALCRDARPEWVQGLDQILHRGATAAGRAARPHLYLRLQRHLDEADERLNRRLLALGAGLGLPVVATGGVLHARPEDRRLLDVMTCVRRHTTLDTAGRLLARNAERHLARPFEMVERFRDLPAALLATREIAARCEFQLGRLGYRFPRYPVPHGHTQASFLAELAWTGARDRYRSRPGHPAPPWPKVRAQIEHELGLIERLDLPGYFLIVWDLVRYCREQGIAVQGRGSAANSAVCYALGITAVDPVGMELLFERFLNADRVDVERGEVPDIDLDLPSGDHREQVIQYVYERYGRAGVPENREGPEGTRLSGGGAGMTAVAITYRERSAVREVGKALGFPADTLDRLAKLTGGFEFRGPETGTGGDGVRAQLQSVGLQPDAPRVRLLLELLGQIYGLPRHLGQHPGGMVIADGRLDEIVPLEAAAMPGRTLVQWDKEDIADLGIIKFDLLGLGMMAMLEEAQVTLAARGRSFDLAHVPPGDPATYQLLQRAETIGVFQVESRAQMSCLPRLKPRCFYDLVIEVAIIRPGPIQGNSVHPYLERRAGRQAVRYAHPVLEPILKRTLGVPLFQEQAMRIAMAAADFTAAEADELRRAMGHKRSRERMLKIKDRLLSGMQRKGISVTACDEIWTQLQAFADYGFPESHSASFALLVYASAYLKVHEPEVFYAALLNCQPMGFYSAATITREAMQRGVRLLPVDVLCSRWRTALVEDAPDPTRAGRPALRLGLLQVVGLGEVARGHLEVLINGLRETPLWPATLPAFVRRARQAGLGPRDLERLAEAGALRQLVRSRREALWQLRALALEAPLAPAPLESGPGPLAPMSVGERIGADYRTTGLTLGPHPMSFHRAGLDAQRFLRAVDLAQARHDRRVRVAGQVIVRQRPGSAKGVFFLTLEDETGLINLIVKPERFQQDRALLARASFLAIEGQLQNRDGVISVRVERARELPPPPLGPTSPPPSRDFR